MLIILSPAKTLDYSKQEQTDVYTMPELLDDSDVLMKELKKLSEKDLADLMSINPDLARLNFERNLMWKKKYGTKEAKQALLAFKGEVYNGIKAWELNKDQLDFAQNHVRMLSGLYGVLRPLDLMMPYRLEMGTKLENPGGKDLYKFWDTKITELINAQLKKDEEGVLVNLASNEYYKSVKSKQINGRIVTPTFKEQKGDDFKVITVYAKKARGLMTRYMIDKKLKSVEQLKLFDYEGYMFNDRLSTENDWVFTR